MKDGDLRVYPRIIHIFGAICVDKYFFGAQVSVKPKSRRLTLPDGEIFLLIS